MEIKVDYEPCSEEVIEMLSDLVFWNNLDREKFVNELINDSQEEKILDLFKYCIEQIE